MLDQATKKRIDDCRNILVGKITDPKSQVEQITIALIYKFMDDMDSEALEMGGVPTYFIGDYERYSWKNIFSPRIGGDEMLALYGEGMVKMHLNPNLPQLFRDIFKNAYLPYRDPETLRLFLRTINDFKYDHSERLGDAFEYLLSVLGSQGDAGQFRTPRHIIDFIVKIIDPKKNETICDPACGTSGFIISGFKHILQSNTNKVLGDKLTPEERRKLMTNISGYDISPDMVRLSLVNLFLHGFPNPKVYEYDTLTSEDRWNEYYDVILANPPFMSPKGGIRPHKRFGIESNRAEVLFVDYIMEHLTPKGRAGIVVPEGIILQTNAAYKSLRKMLVEKYLIGVISLPSGVFQPYSGVKTSILILDRELSQKTDKIFFAKVDNDGYDLGAQRREIEKNDLPYLKDLICNYVARKHSGIEVMDNKLNLVSKKDILSSLDLVLNQDVYREKIKHDSQIPQVQLGNVSTFIRGLTYSKNDEVQSGGIKVLRANNIDVNTGKVDFSDVKQVSKDLNPPEKILLRKNDIFICTASGSKEHVGKVAFIEENLDFYFGGFMGVLRVTDNINPKYLFYLLRHENFNTYLRNSILGANINNLKSKILNNYTIPLPPIEVQEEIVRELEQYQKIIDGAKQIVDNYKPVIDIDPSWEMRELGDVCEITSSKRIFQEEYTNTGVPFYRTKEIVELSKEEEIKLELFISQDRFDEIKSKYEIPQKGDILLSAVGTIGISYLINSDSPFYFKDGNLLWIRKIDYSLISSYFLKKSLDSIFSRDIKKYTNGAAYSALTIVTLKKIQIPVPPIEIQQSIIEKIEMESEIIKGNKKLIKIYTQKIQDRINKVWDN